MDEIKETREHLWGSISNKIDKIGDEADRLNWGQIIDMMAEALNDGDSMAPMDLFLTLYRFTFLLYYRLRAMDAPEPFNQVSKTTRLENHKDIAYYQVKNYDYKMFKWVVSKRHTTYLNNGWVLIPEDALTASEKRRFDKQLTASGV